MWRKIRIAVLLFVLATVAHRAWLQEQQLNWKDTVNITLYPINVDGSAETSHYISRLDATQFQQIADFLAAESARYGLSISRPFELRLGPVVSKLPPKPQQQGGIMQAILWSLHFRWWAWRNSPPIAMPADMQLYLLYHDPGQYQTLSHSTALNKGRLGMINVYADSRYEQQNAVVITHELLHAVGATDKYERATNQPLFPHGFAEPDKRPRYPQEFAEIMAGRVPVAEGKAEIPAGLAETLVGEKTAAEIGWLRDKF
jgi:hypothetical protein